MVVYWMPEALARLEDIETYIAQYSPFVAKDVVAHLVARTRQLESLPYSGRRLQGAGGADLREVLERPYRLIYRVTTEHVEILTVMHYRQWLPHSTEAWGISEQVLPWCSGVVVSHSFTTRAVS